VQPGSRDETIDAVDGFPFHFGDDVADLEPGLVRGTAGDQGEDLGALTAAAGVSGACRDSHVRVGGMAGADDLVGDGTRVIDGMANPTPILPLVPLLPGAAAIAELIPMT